VKGITFTADELLTSAIFNILSAFSIFQWLILSTFYQREILNLQSPFPPSIKGMERSRKGSDYVVAHRMKGNRAVNDLMIFVVAISITVATLGVEL